MRLIRTAQEIAALNDLDLKRRALNRIVGSTPGTLAVLGNTLQPVAPSPASLDAWIARAEAGSPQLKAQRAAFNIAQLEIERNDSTLDAILPTNAKLEKLADGFAFTEGPV